MTIGIILANIYLFKYIRITNNTATLYESKKIQPSKVVFFCILFSYLKKIYIPPNAKNSTPTTSTKVGEVFARIKAGLWH